MPRPRGRCASSFVARGSFQRRSRPRTTLMRRRSTARAFPRRRSRSSRACWRRSRARACRSTRRSPPSPSRRTTPGQPGCSPACARRLPRARRSLARWRAGRGRFRALSRPRRGRRRDGSASRRARAPRRLPGGTRDPAAEVHDGPHLPRARYRHRACRDRGAAGVRRAAGRLRLSAEPADVAVAHAGADRDERLFPGDAVLSRASSRPGGVRARQSPRRLRSRWHARCCACPSPGASSRRSTRRFREHARHSRQAARSCARWMPPATSWSLPPRRGGCIGGLRERAAARALKGRSISASADPPAANGEAKRSSRRR